MLGPVSNKNEGAGSGTGCVRALSLVTCACRCRCRCMWRCGSAVSAVRAPGLSGGWPPLLQDVWVRLLEVVEGAEEASLDAGHVLLREMGVVLNRGFWARPQQRHEAGCHHAWAELQGGGARGAGSPAVRGGLPLLGAQRDFPQPPVCGIPQVRWVHLARQYIALHKALVAAEDGEQCVQGLAFPRAAEVGVVRLVLLGVRVGAWVVGGGGAQSAGRRRSVPCTTQ